MQKKTIVIGLGNPGKEYKNTYHNAGFLALQSLLARSEDQPKTLKKYKKLFDFLELDQTVLIWPLTFMNDSGKPAREALKKFLGKPEDLIVIHDDSDLTVGHYKTSFARSSAGHKGVQSIIDALGTNAFTRIRIGIRPAQETRRQKAGDFALKKISTKDMAELEKVFGAISVDI